MRIPRSSRSSGVLRPGVVLAAAAVAVALPLAATDAPGPPLRQGLWRYERSFEYADGRPPGAPIVSEICLDPVSEGDSQLAMFRGLGCSAERRQTGATEWRIRVSCDRPGLLEGSSTSTLRTSGRDGFDASIVNDGGMAMPIARERLLARRIGDC